MNQEVCSWNCETGHYAERRNRNMKVTVAGVEKKYPEKLTIKQLIELEQVETPQYVTVSVNDTFAERESFESFILKDRDVIEFLYFMGGGR